MPSWLAYLTPWIDDAPSETVWEGLITRYAELASRWHVLDEEDWRRLDYAVRGVCLREAMEHTQDEKTLKVCRRVLDLCDREAQGEHVDAKTWSAAAAAAAGAEATAEAGAATWAAWATTTAEAAARSAVEAAAASAAAAAAAATAEAAASAAAAEARAAVADRVVAGILDTIEQAVIGKS